MKFKRKFIIAIDVGGTKVNIAFFLRDKLKKILNFTTLKFGPDNIEKIISLLEPSKNEIRMIVISLTGKIENDRWSPINKKMLGYFKNYPVIKKFKSKFKISVFALGDTQAAALGEMFYGAGRKYNNFFYLTVSTGVGGSLIHNRKLFDSKISSIGAIGHTIVKLNGRKCGCGQKGCVEAYASGLSMFKQNKFKNCKDTKDLLTKFNNKKETYKIIKNAVEALIAGIINMHRFIGFKKIIIGGSVGLNYFFYNNFMKTIKKNNLKISISRSRLKNKSELYGCLAFTKIK